MSYSASDFQAAAIGLLRAAGYSVHHDEEGQGVVVESPEAGWWFVSVDPRWLTAPKMIDPQRNATEQEAWEAALRHYFNATA